MSGAGKCWINIHVRRVWVMMGTSFSVLASVLYMLLWSWVAPAHAEQHHASIPGGNTPQHRPPRQLPPSTSTVLVNPFTLSASLVPSSFIFASRSSEGSVSATLQVTGLSGAPGNQRNPLVTDAGQPADNGTQVKITTGPPKLDASNDVLTEDVKITVWKMPADRTEERFLTVQIAGHVLSVGYKLTNVPSTKFSWTLRAPTTWAGRPRQAIPLKISTGSIDANDVKAETLPFLFEKTSGHAAPVRYLSKQIACPLNHEPISLTANTTQDLWLIDCNEPKPSWLSCLWSGGCGYGDYAGTISISSHEKPEGDTISLTLQSTDWKIRVLGTIVLVVCTIVSFLATTGLNKKIDKLTLFEPLARQREEFLRLHVQLSSNLHQENQMAQTEHKLQCLIKQREQFKISPMSDEELRQLAQSGAAWQVALTTIIKDGVGHVDQLSKLDQKSFLDRLDNLAGLSQPPGVDKVTAIINEAVTAPPVGPPVVGVVGTAMALFRSTPTLPRRAPVRSPSSTELLASINSWNFIAFVVLTASTALVGFYNLVWTNSFGTVQDIVSCALWGFGFPIGSKAVTTLASIATTLGLNLSRT
jgi:hypothetical protein